MMKTSQYPTAVIYEGYDRNLALQSVGSGWAALINEVFDFFESAKIKNVRIIQVKEKWGGLRIYTDYMNDAFDQKIREVEKRSFTVCEVSGTPGKLRKCNGWYRTLSDEHGSQFPVVENDD
jgi:hypothetical protein